MVLHDEILISYLSALEYLLFHLVGKIDLFSLLPIKKNYSKLVPLDNFRIPRLEVNSFSVICKIHHGVSLQKSDVSIGSNLVSILFSLENYTC